jgi:hypothetical protein
MATSSFDKDFILKDRKTLESFLEIMRAPGKVVKIDRDLLSPERQLRGEEKLKRILSR